jgi:hypothetical protein
MLLPAALSLLGDETAPASDPIVDRGLPASDYVIYQDEVSGSSFYVYTGLKATRIGGRLELSDLKNVMLINFETLKSKIDPLSGIADVSSRMRRDFNAEIISGFTFGVGGMKAASVSFKWKQKNTVVFQRNVFIEGKDHLFHFSLTIPERLLKQVEGIFDYMVESFRSREYTLALKAAEAGNSINIIPFIFSLVDVKGSGIKFIIPESFEAEQRNNVYYFSEPRQKYYITFKFVPRAHDKDGFKDSTAFVRNLYSLMTQDGKTQVTYNSKCTLAGMSGWNLLFEVPGDDGGILKQYDTVVDGEKYIYSFSLIAESGYYDNAFRIFSAVLNSVTVNKVAINQP